MTDSALTICRVGRGTTYWTENSDVGFQWPIQGYQGAFPVFNASIAGIRAKLGLVIGAVVETYDEKCIIYGLETLSIFRGLVA